MSTHDNFVKVPTYIATFPRGGKTAYGFHLHLDEGIKADYGWMRARRQNTYAQLRALRIILNAVAASDKAMKIALIMRTAHLRSFLSMGEDRKLKKQYGIAVKDLKIDEELFEITPALWAVHGVGIRPASNAKEKAELRKIERHLEDQFHGSPAPFGGDKEVEPEVYL